MRKRTIAAVVITGTTVLAGAAAVGGTASAAQAKRAIANTKPAWASHAERLGHATSSHPVSARVYLAPQGGLAAVEKFATAAATPGSASYHQFLTPAQYYARFGTTNSSASTVASYLRSQGLKVTGTAAHNRYLTVRGTAGNAEKAFGTTLENFKHDGKTVQAPTKNVALPTDVASRVLTVTGLNTAAATMSPASKPAAAPPAGYRNARPCSTYYGQLKATNAADYKTPLPKFDGKTLDYSVCGYTGPQLRSAYEGATKLDGTGVTVAIVDAYASPTIAKDSNTYATNHGDGSYASGQLSQYIGGTFRHGKACGGQSGWYGEETLDVEAVHAMAPGADIDYYGARSCYDNDLGDALQAIVDADHAKIVTNSYGEAEEGESSDQIAAYESTFLQGASEGISFTFSSGDDGDQLASTGVKQAGYPASDPYVTGIGGTSTGIDGNGAISMEAGWGTDKYTLSADGKSWTPVGFVYGAGGGTSTLFNQPSYQAAVTNNAYRQEPDVAMDADPTTGMLIGETQTFSTGRAYGEYRIGGTSLASPLFAGMTALAIQNDGGKGAGMLNPAIYKDAASDFTDVTASPKAAGNVRVDFANGENASKGLLYSVRTFGDDSSLPVTKGYDEVTGVGVPNTSWLTALGGSTG